MEEINEKAAVLFLEKGGKWQTRQMWFCLLGMFVLSFQPLLIVFSGFQPNFACVDNTDDTNSSKEVIYDNKCNALNTTHNTTASCFSGYLYDVDERQSIVSEWNLICKNAYVSQTTQVVFTIGQLVGSFITPVISDRFGRKRVYLSLRVLYPISTFGISLSPNIYYFMAGRFFIGALGAGSLVVLFVFMMENISARLRTFAAVQSSLLWSLALCIEAGATYLMRHLPWRITNAVMSIPSLISLLLEIIFLKESIRWLYANNKTVEASALMQGAMRMNGIKIEEIQDAKELIQKQPEIGTYDERDSKEYICIKGKQIEKDKISILDILRNRATRGISIKMSFVWLVNSFVYFAIFFMSDSFSGDLHLNFFLSALVEIPAAFIMYGLLRWSSRRNLLVGSYGLCSVSLLIGGILMATLKDRIKYIIMMVVTIIGKFAVTVTFTCIYVYTSEVFPTNFRTSGVGIGSVAARIGGLISPFAGVLARELPWGPGVIFGGLCLLVTVVFFWLPETKDRELPKSILEIETMVHREGQDGKEDVHHAQPI